MIDVIPTQTNNTTLLVHFAGAFCIALILWTFICLFLPFMYGRYKELRK
jgi:hypothetical protein